MISVLFFGKLADDCGAKQISLADVALVADALKKLETQYPVLKNQTFAIALNHKTCNSTDVLKAGDVLAFLPPFSGG